MSSSYVNLSIPNTPAQPVTDSQPSLLDLPPELRLEVYDYLFEGQSTFRFWVSSQDDSCRLLSSSNRRNGHPSTALMQTCRQIYHEVTSILYGKSSFVFQTSPNDPCDAAGPQTRAAIGWTEKIGKTSLMYVKKVTIMLPGICRCYRSADNDMEVLPLLQFRRRNPSITIDLVVGTKICDQGPHCVYPLYDMETLRNVIDGLGKGHAGFRAQTQLLRSVLFRPNGRSLKVRYRSTLPHNDIMRFFAIRSKGNQLEPLDYPGSWDEWEHSKKRFQDLPWNILDCIFRAALRHPKEIIISSPFRPRTDPTTYLRPGELLQEACGDFQDNRGRSGSLAHKARSKEILYTENNFVIEELSKEAEASFEDFRTFFDWIDRNADYYHLEETGRVLKLKLVLAFKLQNRTKPDDIRVNFAPFLRWFWFQRDDMATESGYDIDVCFRVLRATDDVLVGPGDETRIKLRLLLARIRWALQESNVSIKDAETITRVWVDRYGLPREVGTYEWKAHFSSDDFQDFRDDQISTKSIYPQAWGPLSKVRWKKW